MTLLKPNPAPIEDDDIWKDDALGREAVASDLTKLILSIQQPFVVSVNGSYGSGKTFLLERWVKQLNKDGQKAIYFNAWETDFSNDPLIAFVACLKSALNDFDPKPKKISLSKLVKQAGLYIAPKLADSLIKKASGDAISLKELENLSDSAALDLFGSAAIGRLRSQEESVKAVRGIHSALAEIGESVLASGNLKNDADRIPAKNIYVFVDELDRCRPTYALEFLETVKHLFNVPGFVFILGIDSAQLKSAMRAVYGPDLDAEGYLRKFIDWELRIPDASPEAFARHLYDKFGIADAFSGADNYVTGGDSFKRFSAIAAQAFGLTLREQEQCFTQANVALRLHAQNAPFSAHLAILLALKAKDDRLYRRFCAGQENYYAVWNLITSLGHVQQKLQAWEQEDLLSLLIECWAPNSDAIHNQSQIIIQITEKGERSNVEHLAFPSESSENELKAHLKVLSKVARTHENIVIQYHGEIRRSIAGTIYERVERTTLYIE